MTLKFRHKNNRVEMNLKKEEKKRLAQGPGVNLFLI